MDILSYLLELLQQRKEVGISGLGTFYKKKFPGRYDKEKQSFLPPAYTLLFSAELKEEDALANFISSKRNLSAESAKYYISKFTEEVNEKLTLAHEAELENIGRLFYTEHEGLSFEPSKNINYGSEFYGLPTIADTVIEETANVVDKNEEDEVFEEIAEAPKVADQPTEVVEKQAPPIIENIELDEVTDDFKNTLKHTENPIIDSHSTPDFIVEQHQEYPHRFGHKPESEESKKYIHLDDEEIVEHEEIIEVPGFVKEQHAEHPNRFGHDPLADHTVAETGKSLWSKIFMGIVILLIIGAVLYFVKPELFKGVQPIQTAPIEVLDSPKVVIDSAKVKQDSIVKADSLLKANLIGGKKIDTVKKVITTPAKKDTVVAKSASIGRFHVIGASFKTTKKAELFIKQMKAYGIDAKIVPIEGPYKKVSLISYKTEKEALDARPSLIKKTKIKELDIKQINTP